MSAGEDVLSLTLEARTPCCGRPVRFDRMVHATVHVHRTCRKCGQRWTVRVAPVMTQPGRLAVHELTWTPEVRP